LALLGAEDCWLLQEASLHHFATFFLLGLIKILPTFNNGNGSILVYGRYTYRIPEDSRLIENIIKLLQHFRTISTVIHNFKQTNNANLQLTMFFNDSAYGYPAGFYEPRRAQNPYTRRGHAYVRQPQPVRDPFGFGQQRYAYETTPQKQRQRQYPQEDVEEEMYSQKPEPVRKSRAIPVRVNQSRTREPQVQTQDETLTNVNGSIAEEREGASLASSPKLYSVASTKTLSNLDKVSAEYTSMLANIDSIEKNTDLTDAASVLNAKHLLAQQAGDIDKLQFTKLDAIQTSELHSGKEMARTQRKGLNQSLEALQQRVQKLYKEYSDIAGALPMPSPASPEGSVCSECPESGEAESESEKGEDEHATEEDGLTGGEVSMEDPLGLMVEEEEAEESSSSATIEASAAEEEEEVSATSMEQGDDADDAALAQDDDAEGWENISHCHAASTPKTSGDSQESEDNIALSIPVSEDKDAVIADLKTQLKKKDALIAHLMLQLKQQENSHQ
jgi:hypothetical protein